MLRSKKNRNQVAGALERARDLRQRDGARLGRAGAVDPRHRALAGGDQLDGAGDGRLTPHRLPRGGLRGERSRLQTVLSTQVQVSQL